MAYQTPLTVKETLDRVAQRRLVLPAIQREYVWVSDQDRMTRLFDSLLRRYPIGTFLFWDVPAAQSKDFDFYEVMRVWHDRDQRHNPRHEVLPSQDLTAILDGQQRITTLNIGLRGSLAQRAKYKRATSVDAYPVKQLYVDLLFSPNEDDDFEYRFAFLTPAQAQDSKESHWYRVGDILDVPEPGLPILRYVQRHDITNEERPFEVLARLWTAVHQDGVVSAFEEKGERLDRVLDIFVRVNSGGVVLSKSDLLLSMATAHFRTRDAREEIHRLVDELNAEGNGFAFSKDLILKAGLVLTGISDIGFRVDNFTATNMAKLETNWDRLSTALRLAVRLLSSFGLSSDTLPANSVLVPVADYIYTRGFSPSYIDSQKATDRADRKAIRSWVLRTILMPGIWGSGLDQLLRGLHRAISDSTDTFPKEPIEQEMARRGKSLDFSPTLVDDLLDTPYKHARAFALLTLLYETVDTLSKFHVDHVFPRALATRTKLRATGVPAEQIDEIGDKVDRLPNLQLLHGPANIDKRAQLPGDWAKARYPDSQARAAWLVESDMSGLPDTFADFLTFFDRRRALMRARLMRLLDANATPTTADWADPARTEPARMAGPTNVVHPDPRPTPTDEPRGGVSSTQRRDAVEQRRARRLENLAALIDDGRLAVGQVLYADYQGERHEAIVDPRGLRVGQRLYDSPSSAGVAVTNGIQVNGWTLWKLPKGIPIADLRRM